MTVSMLKAIDNIKEVIPMGKPALNISAKVLHQCELAGPPNFNF
jgi:hypothetical protein